MRLGYQDRTGGKVYEFKKRKPVHELEFPQSNTDYARRFFENVRGLGNVHIVVIRGNKIRRIATRGF